jgi:hypothetical protein
MPDWKQTASARGKAAEMRFMQLALEEGWDLAVPVSEDSAYDCLVDRHRHGSYERVQVKRCWQKDGYPVVNLVRYDGARYGSEDADWLAAVEVESGICWFVPWLEVFSYTRKRITADMADFQLGGTHG